MASRRGNGRKAKAPAALASGVGAVPAPIPQQTARLPASTTEAPGAGPGAPQQRPTALQTAATKVQQVAAAAASPVVSLAKKLTPKKPAAAAACGDAVVPTCLFSVEEDSEQEGDPEDDTAPAAMADQLLSFDAPQQRSSSTTPSAGASTPQPRNKQQQSAPTEAEAEVEQVAGDTAARGDVAGLDCRSATQRARSWAASTIHQAAAAMELGMQHLRSSCSRVTPGHLAGAAGCVLALMCVLLLITAASTSRLHQQQASKLLEQQAVALQQQALLAAMQRSLQHVQQQLTQLPALQQQLQDTSNNYSSSSAGLHQQQQQLVLELQQLQAQVAGVANATAATPAPATTNSSPLGDPAALQQWVSEVVLQQAEATPRNIGSAACGAYVANHTQLAGSHGAALTLSLLAQRAMGRAVPHLHPAATALLLGGGGAQSQASPRCLKLVASPEPSVGSGMAGVKGDAGAGPAEVVIQLPGLANISKVVVLLVAPTHPSATRGIYNSSAAGGVTALADSAGDLSSAMGAASAVQVGVHQGLLAAAQPVATAQWTAATARTAAAEAAAMGASGPAGRQLHTLEMGIRGGAVGNAVSVQLWAAAAAAAGQGGEGSAGGGAAPAVVCLHRVVVVGRPVPADVHQFVC